MKYRIDINAERGVRDAVIAALEAAFDETEHPRDDEGRFAPGSASSRYVAAQRRLAEIDKEIYKPISADERQKLYDEADVHRDTVHETEVEHFRNTVPHYDALRTSLPDPTLEGRDIRHAIVYHGERLPPNIVAVSQSGGGAVSSVSESYYPAVKVELDNGASFVKQIRISGHDQVSQNAPRSYDVDIRKPSFHDRPSDWKKMQAQLKDELQPHADRLWQEQRSIIGGGVQSKSAAVREPMDAANPDGVAGKAEG